MSHIILKIDFEDAKRALAEAAFLGERVALVLVEKPPYTLPVVVAPGEEGIIIRVENGQNHLDQMPVQEAVAEVAKLLILKTHSKALRSTLSKKVIRKYEIPFA